MLSSLYLSVNISRFLLLDDYILYSESQGPTESEFTDNWSVSLYSALAAIKDPTGSRWYMNHTFHHLQPATDYEATVAVENKFGWSARSEVFRFYTSKGKRVCH